MTASTAFAMDSKPAISVLMAVYNAPKNYLDAAIVSILHQSYLDFEFIIVDDGSDVAASKYLQSRAVGDERIRLLKLPANVGLTKALNEGLKLTRGDYLARQDADDISEPNRLAAQIRFLTTHPDIDAVGTDAVLIDAGGNEVGVMQIDPDLKGLSRRNLLVHGSMLFRRKVFELLGGYDERMRLSQDYELYLRMQRLHGMQLSVLPEAHYRLRQHPDSLSSRRMFRQLYYSVMAKSLTRQHISWLGRRLGFWRDITADFFFTHRLFLGPVVRSLFSGGARHTNCNYMNMEFKAVSACRMCGNSHLIDVVDLGEQYLTGVFPRAGEAAHLTKGPLQLVKCHGDEAAACGLVQLRQTYETHEMYGTNYGYRSGLNGSMVTHLQSKIARVVEQGLLASGDLVIDIGSNDGTALAAFPGRTERVGVDPVGEKFRKFYPQGVALIPEFFSGALIQQRYPGRKAKVITSFSMMYDVENPMQFVREIAELLDPDYGVWVSEQSYLPLMLERMAFDTICHEHIEYYALRQVEWLLERADMCLLDVELNDVNGGSFSFTAARRSSRHLPNDGAIAAVRESEARLDLDSLTYYDAFGAGIDGACAALQDFVRQARAEGKRVCALGASTKGNVLLQRCGLTPHDIEVIGEVNPDKFGAVTPGTWIPIDDEKKVIASGPDYLVVLPWHFKANFLANPDYHGLTLVFPLPYLEIIRA